MSEQARIETAIDTTIDNCEVLRARLAKYEDAEGRPLHIDVNKAARALCNRHADICGVDREDQWKTYSQDFIEDAATVLAALEAKPSGMALPERMTWDGLRATACNIRGEGWNACLDEVSRLNPAPSHGEQVRDGWKLVPERMHLSREAIESITAHCGDGQEDAGYGPYSDGVLWVGEIEEEDGAKTYGLHIATTDYPEEGSTTLVEFAAPSAASQKGGE